MGKAALRHDCGQQVFINIVYSPIVHARSGHFSLQPSLAEQNTAEMILHFKCNATSRDWITGCAGHSGQATGTGGGPPLPLVRRVSSSDSDHHATMPP